MSRGSGTAREGSRMDYIYKDEKSTNWEDVKQLRLDIDMSSSSSPSSCWTGPYYRIYMSRLTPLLPVHGMKRARRQGRSTLPTEDPSGPVARPLARGRRGKVFNRGSIIQEAMAQSYTTSPVSCSLRRVVRLNWLFWSYGEFLRH